MNTKEANALSIVQWLEAQGLKIEKQTQADTWFLSPLHAEKTPSFKVNNQKNIWYDHAQGVGGRLIDLIMQIDNCNVSDALKRLGDGVHSSFSSSPAPLLKKEDEDEFEIVSVRDLKNPVLIKYLEGRRIDIAIAKKFVLEIFFKKKKSIGKNLFAIAFKNDEEGYETRNALFKGNLGGKAITTIKGTEGQNVAVFEGFIDFLSVLTKYGMKEFKDDVIILNSLSMIGGVKEKLKTYNSQKYFLDNDKAGRESTRDLIETIGGVDASILYKDFKDANDWLVSHKN